MSFDKKLYDKINRVERIQKELVHNQRNAVQYLQQEYNGYIEAEEGEKTLKINQSYFKENAPKFNKDNIFDLNLKFGPYKIDYTANGSYVLLAGEKGHISMLDWRNKNLECEFHVREKIRSVKFLHNETMFAVAQRKKLFIYDKQGIELHSLDYHVDPKFLEFLNYHFLLVSANKTGYFKFNIGLSNIKMYQWGK